MVKKGILHHPTREMPLLFSTLLVDVLYAWLDPRISYETITA